MRRQFIGGIQRGHGDLDVDDVACVHAVDGGGTDVIDPNRAVAAHGAKPGQDSVGLLRPGRVGGHQPVRVRGGRRGGDVMGERQDPLIPELAGPLHQFPFGTRVVQPDVGHPASLLVSGLRGDVDELNHPAAELAVALAQAGYDGRGLIIASDHMMAGMLRTRFPQAPVDSCAWGAEQITR